jgi:hypothetical protein
LKGIKITSKPEVKKESFSHDVLDKALMKAEEIADRCLLKLLVLDETADSIYNKKDLYGDCITIGLREADATSTFKTALQYALGETHPERLEKTSYGYLAKAIVQSKGVEMVTVPIKVKIITRRYSFLHPKVLDCQLYGYNYYYLPNPFAKYWKVRSIVR